MSYAEISYSGSGPLPSMAVKRPLVSDTFVAAADPTLSSDGAFNIANSQTANGIWSIGTAGAMAGSGATSSGCDLVFNASRNDGTAHVVSTPLGVNRLTGQVSLAGLYMVPGNASGTLLPNCGDVSLNGTTPVTVAANCNATSQIFISRKIPSGTAGHLNVANISNGSFQVVSTGTEVSRVSWLVVSTP